MHYMHLLLRRLPCSTMFLTSENKSRCLLDEKYILKMFERLQNFHENWYVLLLSFKENLSSIKDIPGIIKVLHKHLS